MLFSIYQNVVVLLAIFLMGMLTGAWLLSAYMRWSEQLAQLGCDDPTEPIGYIDQDGDRTPARHQWRNGSVHRPHAQD
ncbi:hypothetical protein K6V90_09455 [Cupriavidus pauculus]|uniref:hypothetical protein n=1 Tax=Cupriavidus pauculus TaxID=82633 RepID=UPI001C9337DB|nr:hypothetical protein [Cupriavidus pauculus]MBY4730757.1 hypothetical protein [Cupriavidus pauculus]